MRTTIGVRARRAEIPKRKDVVPSTTGADIALIKWEMLNELPGRGDVDIIKAIAVNAAVNKAKPIAAPR